LRLRRPGIHVSDLREKRARRGTRVGRVPRACTASRWRP